MLQWHLIMDMSRISAWLQLWSQTCSLPLGQLHLMLSIGAPGNSTDKQHQFLFVEAERSSEVKENVTGDLIQRYSRAK